MVALCASKTPFWSPYTVQIHPRSAAHTPFQTVSWLSSVGTRPDAFATVTVLLLLRPLRRLLYLLTYTVT
jgi:hypothetical protein